MIGAHRSATEPGAEIESDVANGLNQCERAETEAASPAVERCTYDGDGNLVNAYVVGDMSCNGVLDT